MKLEKTSRERIGRFACVGFLYLGEVGEVREEMRIESGKYG